MTGWDEDIAVKLTTRHAKRRQKETRAGILAE